VTGFYPEMDKDIHVKFGSQIDLWSQG